MQLRNAEMHGNRKHKREERQRKEERRSDERETGYGNGELGKFRIGNNVKEMEEMETLSAEVKKLSSVSNWS